MRAILVHGLLGLTLAWLVTGAAWADGAAPPGKPTPGDRLAASGTVKGLKRFSERVGSGVGGALDKAGSATGRASAAVSGAFDGFDAKVTGWMGGLGFKPLDDEARRARARQADRDD